MTKSISVMLIEDNAEYRETIRFALLDEPEIELANQFGSAEMAIHKLQETDASAHPDIVLLDVRLPGIDGIEAIPQILSCSPCSKIIVLTQSNQEKDVMRAISAGAAGYLLKSATLSELTSGIRTVIAGGASLDPAVASLLVKTFQARLPPSPEQQILSNREMDILDLLAVGLSKKEIAKKLGIKYTTVDTHVSHIYLKLKVRNAPSAVNEAHRLNLFPPKS